MASGNIAAWVWQLIKNSPSNHNPEKTMSDPTQNPPAKIPSAVRTIAEYLGSDAQRGAIAQAMPSHLEIDRFMRCLFTALQRTPKLADCSRESVYDSVIKSAQCGLNPDGYEAHLIPYGTKCTFIPDYKGMVKLALQSGQISKFDAEVVCENDEFDYNMGEIKLFRRADVHPDKMKRMTRGDIYAVYVVCTFKDGTTKAELMSYGDVERIRDRSKAGGSGPWVTDWAEMAKKTVFKRMSKWLPRSPELVRAIESDDDTIDFDRNSRANLPPRRTDGIEMARAEPAIAEISPTSPVATVQSQDTTSAEAYLKKAGFTA